MGCTNCYDLCDLNTYSDSLGTVDLAEGEAIELIIEHIGSGRVQTQLGETGPDGEVSIDLTDEFIQDGESYRVQVTEFGYTSEALPITPDSNEAAYGCVSFTYQMIC